RAADPPALHCWRDIDRILYAPAISRARPIGARIGEADDLAIKLCHQIRMAADPQGLVAFRHFALAGWLDLEGCSAVPHGMLVDLGNRCEIARLGGADGKGGHESEAIDAPIISRCSRAVRLGSCKCNGAPAPSPGRHFSGRPLRSLSDGRRGSAIGTRTG